MAHSCGMPTGILSVALLAGCVGTTTRLAPVPREAVEAEKERQRELALQAHEAQQARLDSVAYPILASAAPMCPEAIGRPLGIRVASLEHYDQPYRAAAARALSLTDTATILTVIPDSPADQAGLQPGDRVLRLGEHSIRPGAASVADLADWAKGFRAANAAQQTVTYSRNGQARQVTLTLAPVCDYGTLVIQSGALNAYADGENIVLTSAMMRFTSDDELRVVVAHELAHNAMGHIEAKKKNSLFGALLGALGDVLLASQGIRTGGYYAAEGARIGATTFSQDFEREADYVGLYALAMADMPLDAAPRFWRHMAQADPKSIEMAFSHPTPAERFVRMEQAIREIERKRSLDLALSPEMKGRESDGFPAEGQGAYALGVQASEPPAARPSRADAPPETPALTDPTPADGSIAVPVHAAGAQASSIGSDHRSLQELRSNQGLRLIIGDVIRLGLVEAVTEIRPGLLMVSLSPSGLNGTSALYHLQRLYLAYSDATPEREEVALELRRRQSLYGWFGRDGLTLARTE